MERIRSGVSWGERNRRTRPGFCRGMQTIRKILGATLALIAAQGLGGTSAGTTPVYPDQETLFRAVDEERVAWQVYQALAVAWPEAVQFAHIAQAEARHYAAMADQWARLGDGRAMGGVADEPLLAEHRALRDKLIAAGKVSREAALAVGKQIEEENIAHLTGLIEGSEDAALRTVAENLREASRRHLRAFSGGRHGKGSSQ